MTEIKTLTDVIKFVNEYWNRCFFIKWTKTPIGEKAIEGLARLGQFTIYFGDDNFTSTGDYE